MNQLFYNIINVVFNLNIITIKSSLKTVRVNVYVTILFYHSFQRFYLNPRTNTQIHTTTVAQEGGGWMESLSRVFDMLQYLETILPLVESL